MPSLPSLAPLLQQGLQQVFLQAFQLQVQELRQSSLLQASQVLQVFPQAAPELQALLLQQEPQLPLPQSPRLQVQELL